MIMAVTVAMMVMAVIVIVTMIAVALRHVRCWRSPPAPPKSAKLRDKQVKADARDERVAHAFEVI
jgi:hypothetical protein